MKRKWRHNIWLLVFLAAFFVSLGAARVKEFAQWSRLKETTVTSSKFRQMKIQDELLQYMNQEGCSGIDVGVYLLESEFGEKIEGTLTKKQLNQWKKKWEKHPLFREYVTYVRAIWDDVQYFPVPDSTTEKQIAVLYQDSWMTERTYGGKRGHEGTDLMAKKNVRGLYPVISMTDGVVEQKGWLEKGGYRIGIRSPAGGYFYYAHLDSYGELEVGDLVEAGTILGFMGDTGYGTEGTKGKFPVHLHVGIYVDIEGKEQSVNPYWILKYLEKNRLKCAY